MGLPSGNPRDRRVFRHYAKVADDGTVVAVVEMAVEAPAPADHEGHLYVDVTDLHPSDLSAVTVSPASVAIMKMVPAASVDLMHATAAIAQARARVVMALAQGKVVG